MTYIPRGFAAMHGVRSGKGEQGQAVHLDPTDPFDAALIPIVEMNRRKRRDYAHDGHDPFTNFRVTSDLLGQAGFGPLESATFNILQKIARLQSLRRNGRFYDPANEAVDDTYLDLAVYSIIAYALIRERNSEPSGPAATQ